MIDSSEITDKKLYMNRRRFLKSSAGMTAGLLAMGLLSKIPLIAEAAGLKSVKKYNGASGEKITNIKDVTHYNNFYEFSTGKEDVAELSKDFKTRPWNVSVEGLVKTPKVYSIDEILKLFPLEERIYRHRCVEGWSIVVPWMGFPVSEILQRSKPLGNAKFVEFTTVYSPQQMPGQRSKILDWPYVEGLRMDEAMHPLAIICVGMYGEALPNQDGAPIRLVVPWKYGFKSIKSIVRIKLVEKMPVSTWMKAVPDEYGFYANVNPNADHARWSQKKERRLGELLERDTLMFNGYADQVAHLYSGMDLNKNF